MSVLEPPPPAGFVWADTETAEAPATAAPASIGAVPASQVVVHADADAVSAKIMEIVNEAASAAIAKRGEFALAIPGGSVLKMLAGSKPSWADKCTLA